MRVLLVAIMAAVLLQGCVINVNDDDWDEHESDWRAAQQRNSHAIDVMTMGTSESAVLADLGSPDFTDAFQRDGDTYNIFFYRTRHMKSDGRTTRDETTPIVFRNGEVVGWGASAVANFTDD